VRLKVEANAASIEAIEVLVNGRQATTSAMRNATARLAVTPTPERNVVVPLEQGSALQRTFGCRLMFVDTCHAAIGGVKGKAEAHSHMRFITQWPSSRSPHTIVVAGLWSRKLQRCFGLPAQNRRSCRARTACRTYL
jgi:hypothetical protein